MNNPRIRSFLDSLVNHRVKVRFRNGTEIEGIFFDYNFRTPLIIIIRKDNGEYVLCNFASIDFMESLNSAGKI
jgi:hypothetical protein